MKDEAELRNLVADLLRAQGHQVRTEVSLPGRFRVDILAEKEDITRAIEVKMSARGIANDISKCQRLLRLPEITEAYVAAPDVFVSWEHTAFAEQVGVGIIKFTESELKWALCSRRLELPKLWTSISHPTSVRPGQTFKLGKSVQNRGQKIARKLQAYWLRTDVFVTAKGGRRLVKRSSLEPDSEWRVEFAIRVKPQTRAGKYPLLSVVVAEKAEREASTVMIEVRDSEEPPRRPPIPTIDEFLQALR